MKRLKVWGVEVYPVYIEHNDGDFVEVTDEFYDKFKRVMMEFEEIQEDMKVFYKNPELLENNK